MTPDRMTAAEARERAVMLAVPDVYDDIEAETRVRAAIERAQWGMVVEVLEALWYNSGDVEKALAEAERHLEEA